MLKYFQCSTQQKRKLNFQTFDVRQEMVLRNYVGNSWAQETLNFSLIQKYFSVNC